ncbi:hypothetical protein [Bacillus pseudomycoides]|uniref:hypothetical protein n=1 Tax=Bacillus pseudomycoides TaxID=64104 RepID=UPI000BED824F|nr:hypothetical protein [Bacillus pseudomycoides]PEE42803.1 hypothetical protein COO02_05645 [Bacillus pseudomycoides]PGA90890.1 hypothetical protein COL91_12310 [Bacillus pseudomycoides]
MKLSKQEQTVIIGQLINIIGFGLAKQCIDPQKLEKAVAMHNEISDDMTPKQTRETLISVLDKTIDEFLKA